MVAEASRKTEINVDKEGVREILLEQYSLYEIKHHKSDDFQEGTARTVAPRAHTLVDIYKCFHQGEFGPGHLIDNPTRSKEGIAKDLTRTQPGEEDEPILEKVAPDGSVLRINLRPYRKLFKGEDVKAVDQMAQVFFESAAARSGRPERFRAIMNEFRRLNNRGQLTVGGLTFMFPPGMVEQFFNELDQFVRRMGTIPAFSHSKTYRYFNDPRYRVAYLDVLKKSPLAFLLEQWGEG